MKNETIQSLLVAALCAVALSSSTQSFGEVANATLDAMQEASAQSKDPADIKDIFAEAKKAEEEENKLNLCGFYTGMSATDAQTLAAHYGLKDGEWGVAGDPVYKITLSLKGVRRVTKGGNTFDELARAVANRVGILKQNGETKVYSLKTINGIFVSMSESSGFSMVEENVHFAEPKSFRTEAKVVTISDSIELALQSVPGGLWFGKTEVTQSQWEAVMGTNPSLFKGADNPVENVSWNDCQTFLKKLNALPAAKESGLKFRLPTEDEWKNACRADAPVYCEPAELATLDEVAWYKENSDFTTHPVGRKKPNAFGLYDMHGNVWELTDSAVGEDYVFRGGSWFHSARYCVSSCRSWGTPSYRNFFLGFRLCASGRAD